MEVFAKMVNGSKPLFIFTKISILDACHVSEYASDHSIRMFNLFVPNAPFLHPLKTSCFQGVEKGCIGNKGRNVRYFTRSTFSRSLVHKKNFGLDKTN